MPIKCEVMLYKQKGAKKKKGFSLTPEKKKLLKVRCLRRAGVITPCSSNINQGQLQKLSVGMTGSGAEPQRDRGADPLRGGIRLHI